MRVRGDADQTLPSFIVETDGTRMASADLDDQDIGRWLWFRSGVVNELLGHRGFSLKWYTAETGGIGSTSGLVTHFGINYSDLITVHAYDVARLAAWEQHIWAAHNVVPEGKVSQELLAAQVRVEPASTHAVEELLFRSMRLLEKGFRQDFGISLFTHDIDDEAVMQHVSRFASKDQGSLLRLAKELIRVFSDRLNVRELRTLSSHAEKEKFGSNKLLEDVLAQRIGADKARHVFGVVTGAYDMRVGDAHPTGSKIRDALKLAGIDEIRHTSGTTLSLTNSTVSANTAGYTGGIFSDHFGAQLTNSIVAGNSAGDANFSADFINVGSFVGGDPQLGALADNGGPTQTMLPLAGSPVVDAVACTNAPAKDQRGVARPQGAQCDIGAVEVGHPASLTVDTTADTQVEDGKCSLREAIVIFTQGRTGTDCTPSASAVNEVLFAPALANNSIAVASPLALDNNVEVTIDGSAAPGLAIDGGNATFIFNVLAGSTVTIQHLRMVNGNSAGSDGGAIDNAGTLTLTDTALNNNISNGGGGAINNLGTLNIDHSTLSNNFSSASGGAISAQTGVLTVTASTINDNIAAAGGGVFVAAGGTLNLIGSNVSTNHASATSGGGVGGNGHFVVANSTFSANTAATDGGAIYNNKASNTNKVVNSTLAGNTAANGGNLANAAGTLLLQNSIVANSGGGGNCHGTVTAGTGFMTWPASDTTCGAFSIGNPVLGPLQDNGGPTFTMLPGAGSALLDAGNSATCAAAPVSNRDQRGVARPQGAGCDIGAVELVTDRIFAGNFDGTPPL